LRKLPSWTIARLPQRSPLDDNIQRGASQVSFPLSMDPVKLRIATHHLWDRKFPKGRIRRELGWLGRINLRQPAQQRVDGFSGVQFDVYRMDQIFLETWTQYQPIRSRPRSVPCP
jgi:hypothetical protein